MLYSIDGREITDIPGRRRANFDTWVGNLAPADYDDVRRAINEYVDGVPTDKPFNSSFVPGNNWTGTPYQPLYNACQRNEEHSGWFFGLILWQVMIDHSDDWFFKPSDKDDGILGTVYWRRNISNGDNF